MATGQQFWGSKDYKLNALELSMLEKARRQAIQAETVVNERCKEVLYEEKKISDKELKRGIPKHGYFIKRFYDIYFNRDFSIYSSQQVWTTFMDEYGDKILQYFKDNVTDIELKEIGIETVINKLNQMLNEGKNHSARGYYSEAVTLHTLFKNLKKEFGDTVSITNTDSIYNDQGLFYDIDVSIMDKDSDLERLHLKLENKLGINQQYTNSSFHFGDFSSNAFVFDTKNVYATLTEVLQKSFKHYIEKSTAGQDLDKWIYRTIVYWAIQFIVWKVSHGYPIFVSDKAKSVNLCSEILEGFKSNPGGSVEFTLDDFIQIIELDLSRERNSKEQGGWRYVQTKTLDYTELESYIKNTDFGGQWYATERFNAPLRIDEIRISPSFKASVWYGR